jgi:hypothetical protein
LLEALEGLGPLAEDLLRQRGVADHQDRLRPQVEHVDRAVATGPVLEVEVQPLEGDPEEVAQKR